jgi:hypothetical protein
MAIRISLSVSVMRSPLRSTVTLYSVPVNRNGARYSGVTGRPGLAPQVSPPGLKATGVVTGSSAYPSSWPST